jgi:hypothetical protein
VRPHFRILALALLVARPTVAPAQTRTIDVEIPTEPWRGWKTGLIDEDPDPVKQEPERFTAYRTPDGERALYEGRVAGVDSLDGVEVCIMPAPEHEYISNVAYDWVMVAVDGSFRLAAPPRLGQRSRTLCVRAPDRPWTFLRRDFQPDESARDIVLTPARGKRVTISASLRDEPGKGWMTAEAFDGYQRYDDRGKPCRSQYYGGRQSDDGTTSLLLPLRPMALRVRAAGSAFGCVVVDPRQVDHVVTTLPREARLAGRVVDGDRPVGNRALWLFNPCARLSAAAVETDNDGNFRLEGLVPGQYVCLVADQQFVIPLSRDQTTHAKLDIAQRDK